MSHRILTLAVAATALCSLVAVGWGSSGFRDAMPDTPAWITRSSVGKHLRAVAIAAVADNPSCSTRSAIAGLVTAANVREQFVSLRENSHLVRTDADGYSLWATPAGEFWIPYADDFWSLAVTLAEQDADIYGAPSDGGVRAGDVVIDAGAHIGLFTRTALAQGAERVIAFEINPRTLEAFRRNLAEPIRSGRVILLDKGVWNEPDVLTLREEVRCSACIALDENAAPEQRIDVELTTIDAVVEELGLERVDFIKLDVENAEAKALLGAKSTLRRFEPRLAVAVENADDVHAFIGEVDSAARGGHDDYRFRCGASSFSRDENLVTAEILHFAP